MITTGIASVPSSPRRTALLERHLSGLQGHRPSTPEVSLLTTLSPKRSKPRLSLLPPQDYSGRVFLRRVPLEDDFYLNLLDWGPNGLIATGQGSSVLVYNEKREHSVWHGSSDGSALETEDIAAVCFSRTEHNQLAVSDKSGKIVVVNDHGPVVKLTGHCSRVGVLNYNPTINNLLSSGGRDSRICHFDVRAGRRPFHQQSHCGHRQEVCGLRWSEDGRLIASGGNDNTLCVFDANMLDGKPLMRIEAAHSAAIKALAWLHPSDRGHRLISGGGTSDRRIILWDVENASKVGSIQTTSQVCCLFTSELNNGSTIVSTHGFTDHHVALWDVKQFSDSVNVNVDSTATMTTANFGSGMPMEPLKCFTGHGLRVLYAGRSPCQSWIATGAGDGTVRLWHCFHEPNKTILRRRLESMFSYA